MQTLFTSESKQALCILRKICSRMLDLKQLKIDMDAFSHPPSPTFFLKGLHLTLWRNIMERLALGGRTINTLAEEEQEL